MRVGVAILLAMAASGWIGYQFPLLVAFAARTSRALALLALALAALIGWGLGAFAWLERRPAADGDVHLASDSRAVRWHLALAIGGAVTGTVGSLLAPLYWPGSLGWGLWILAGTVLLVVCRGRLRLRLPWSASGGSDRSRPLETASWLSGLFLVPVVVHALAPATALDSVVYHLAVPRQYEIAGSLIDLPWNVHSYFPRLGAVLFGMTLSLDDEGVVAQLLVAGVALATMASVARAGSRLFGGSAGLWAALLLISVPALNLVAGWAYVDWLVLLFAMSAIEIGCTGSLSSGSVSSGHLSSRSRLMLVGLLAGAAAATKYTALPVLLLPVLFSLGRPLSSLLGAVALSLVPSLTWWSSNLFFTGAPLFPLLSGETAASFLASYRGLGVPLGDRLLGYLADPRLSDESLGLALPAVLAGLVAGLGVRSRVSTWPLMVLAAVYLPVLMLQHPTVRSFSVPMLIGALFGGAMLSRWLAHSRPAVRVAIALALAVALTFNGVLIASVLEFYRPWNVVLGAESSSQFLEHDRRWARPFREIESNTSPETGVLMVGESRSFHLRRRVIAASYLDPHPIRFFAADGCRGRCLAQRLLARGLEVVYFDPTRYRVGESLEGARSLTDEVFFRVSVEDDEIFRELLEEHTLLLARYGPVEIRRVVEAAGEAAASPSPDDG